MLPGLMQGIGSMAGGLGGLFGGGGGQASDGTFLQNQANANYAHQKEFFQMNADLQREFAQNGIKWRRDDAVRAGLHPLAALGAAGASYSPSNFVGSQPQEPSPGRPDRRDVLGSLGQMGQGLGRAIAATQTPAEKVLTAFEIRRQQQQLEHGDLQNALLASQIARQQRDQVGPGMPGQTVSGPSGLHEVKPYETNTTNPQTPYAGAGPGQPEIEWRNVPGRPGEVAAYPGKGLNIDDFSAPGYTGWMWRNRVLPFFGLQEGKPPDTMLPQGAVGWTHHFGSWVPRYPARDFSHLPKHMQDYPRGDHHGPRR